MNEGISKTQEYQGKIWPRFCGAENGKYGKILRMIRTPTSEEYHKIVILTGTGIILLGAVGFTIMLLAGLLISSA
ncbi:MAG: protein translocase SEC61 complex subunit gamma [archaeon]|nr:protein translocase SEC61 complex subunit gamma [archaeon]